MEQHAGLDPTWYNVLRLPAAGRYFVRCNLASFLMSNAERRTPIEEVDF
jgi:hypothetical protein